MCRFFTYTRVQACSSPRAVIPVMQFFESDRGQDVSRPQVETDFPVCHVIRFPLN